MRLRVVIALCSMVAATGAGLLAPVAATAANSGLPHKERIELVSGPSRTGLFNVYARFGDVNSDPGLVAVLLVLPAPYHKTRIRAQLTEVTSDSITTLVDTGCRQARINCSAVMAAHQALVGATGQLPPNARLIFVVQGPGRIHIATARRLQIHGPDGNFNWRTRSEAPTAWGAQLESAARYDGFGSIVVATIPCSFRRSPIGTATLETAADTRRIRLQCPNRYFVVVQQASATHWRLTATDVSLSGNDTRLLTTTT